MTANSPAHRKLIHHNRSLSELAVQLKRSFLQYLAYTSPYIPPEAHSIWRTLGQLAETQLSHAEAILDVLTDRRFVAVDCAFPMEFATHHYVSLNYLLGPLCLDQQQRASLARQAAHELMDDVEARPLLERIASGEVLISQEIEKLQQGIAQNQRG